jgi:hypothetical protein
MLFELARISLSLLLTCANIMPTHSKSIAPAVTWDYHTKRSNSHLEVYSNSFYFITLVSGTANGSEKLPAHNAFGLLRDYNGSAKQPGKTKRPNNSCGSWNINCGMEAKLYVVKVKSFWGVGSKTKLIFDLTWLKTWQVLAYRLRQRLRCPFSKAECWWTTAKADADYQLLRVAAKRK